MTQDNELSKFETVPPRPAPRTVTPAPAPPRRLTAPPRRLTAPPRRLTAPQRRSTAPAAPAHRTAAPAHRTAAPVYRARCGGSPHATPAKINDLFLCHYLCSKISVSPGQAAAP